MAIVRQVQDEADAVAACQEECESQQPGGESPESPPAGFGGEDEDDGEEEAEEDVEGTEDAAEDDARFVAVGGGPVDEVRVRVVAEVLRG